MSGWIKLHRSIQDHFIYDFAEPDKAMAWIDILLSASYAVSKVKIKSRLFTVQKGQWLVSQVTLQKRWKMSQNKVKRLLKLLENDGMITVLTNELTSIITICNYSDYQNDERASEQPSGRAVERAADEQSNDIQRSKEYKEDKEVKTNVDSGESPAEQEDYLETEFNRFWRNYPNPKAKQPAKKAFLKLLKGKTIGKVKFNVDMILSYHFDCIERGDIGADKLHAATLLNQKRWEDNPDFIEQFKQDWLKENASGKPE